ncbi:MAG TPA: Uma2 family endonuclease [Anaerolineae bacterium]|nr:Uma2 family endonuclease [Anaerolineae bacterium]
MLEQKTKVTPEEYLLREAAAEYKSEYIGGEIRAMAGGSLNHGVIQGNVITSLNNALADKPCRVTTSDVRLLIKRRGDYTYPDAMVICGKTEFQIGRTDVVTNPTVIVEVLSPSTRNYDLLEKFALYKQIDSLQEYVLIDSQRVHVTLLRRETETGKWTLEMLDASTDILTLTSLEIQIPLASLYSKIEFQTS